MLPEIGVAGQERLKAARVLCLGAGGLGSPAALYLAAAGIGTIGLVDDDRVALSNLHRQLLHGTKDVGRPKTESARDRLSDVNPQIEVRLHACRFESANAEEILRDYDLIVDGTGQFRDALSFQRCRGFRAQAECLWLHLSVRWADDGLRAASRRPLLSLPFSRAAAARRSPELRGSRRAWRAAGDRWHDAGDGGAQADSRDRRAADRPSRPFRCAEDEVSGI